MPLRKPRKKIVELKVNVTLLAYADMNLLRDSTETINKNKDILTDDSREIRLEVNIEKTIC
jgi:hypothetical protein